MFVPFPPVLDNRAPLHLLRTSFFYLRCFTSIPIPTRPRGFDRTLLDFLFRLSFFKPDVKTITLHELRCPIFDRSFEGFLQIEEEGPWNVVARIIYHFHYYYDE